MVDQPQPAVPAAAGSGSAACGRRSSRARRARRRPPRSSASGAGPGRRAERQRAGEEVDAEVRARRSRAARSWISGSGSARPSVGIELDAATSSGTAKPSARASSPDDDLGDERLRPLARAAELEHVEPVVVGLDEGGQRPALPQRRHVPRRRDLAHRARAYRHTPVALDRFCRDAALRRSRPGTRHLNSRAGPRPRWGMKPLDQGAAIPPMGHNMRRVRSAYRTRPDHRDGTEGEK